MKPLFESIGSALQALSGLAVAAEAMAGDTLQQPLPTPAREAADDSWRAGASCSAMSPSGALAGFIRYFVGG